MRSRAFATVAMLSLTGCWKDDYAPVEQGVLDFQPQVDAPAGWVVAPFDVPLDCPDKSQTRFYLLYPKDAGSAPMPAAVMYHGGAFDFVYAPDPLDPLGGTHYADPSRLTREYAIHQVFATLGMYPEPAPERSDEGMLAAELAKNGVAVMLPANCWGDLWGSESGQADNSVVDDHFLRQGRGAADFAYQFLVDPSFAARFGVELPIQVDPAKTYVVGLGEGGRGAGEILSADIDGDGTPDYHPAGVLVDSPPDDLSVLLADPGLYSSIDEGLLRVYPDGVSATLSGSLASAPLPPRVGYAYSTNDPLWPPEVHAAAVARIQAAGGWIHQSDQPVNGLLNAGDLGAAQDAVDYLLGQ